MILFGAMHSDSVLAIFAHQTRAFPWPYFFLPTEATSNLVPLVHTLVPSQTLCRTKLQMCVYRLSKSLIWILYDKNTFPLPSSWIMKMPPHMPYIVLVAFAHLKKLNTSNWLVRNLPGSLGYTSIMPANASQYQLPCDLPRSTVRQYPANSTSRCSCCIDRRCMGLSLS